MKRFKHILATTDLSPESFSAVSYAAHLAEGQAAKLTILHVTHSTSLVYSDFSLPIDMLDIDAAIEDAARDQLEIWAKRHVKHIKRIDLVVRGGITHEVVCEVAAEVGATIIVMATHGRKGIGHLVLGSVTERVLRDAPCPVLVVKPPKSATKLKRKKKTTKRGTRR